MGNNTKRKSVTIAMKEDPPNKESPVGKKMEGEKGVKDKEASRGAMSKDYLSALKSSKYQNLPIQDWSHKRQINKAQLHRFC